MADREPRQRRSWLALTPALFFGEAPGNPRPAQSHYLLLPMCLRPPPMPRLTSEESLAYALLLMFLLLLILMVAW